jgi:SPFH domain / Band 7 family
MKRIVMLAIVAAVAILTGCSAPSTQADEVFVHKGSGITEGHENKGCVPAATREINWGTGMGDDYYPYPASQRFYDYLTSVKEGSDADRFTVVSSDGQQLTVAGSSFFTLNTDCETLQSFHDLIGNREQAYMVDGEMSPGWTKVLNVLMKQPIDNALDTIAKQYTWEQLRFDLTVKDKMAKAVDEALQREVNKKITGDFDYFVNFSTQIQQPIAPPELVAIAQKREADVSQAKADEARSVATANSAKAAADAQKAQKDAELIIAQKEAAIQAAVIRSFGGPEAYAKYQAVQKGINPWQPSYGSSIVNP